MVTEAQKRASEKYRKKNVKQLSVRFFPADMALYEHAKAQPNTMGYIKRLIREDMERNSHEGDGGQPGVE